MKFLIAALMTMAFVGHATAQHQQHHQPYTGLQARAVKALSEQQIADLKAGRGMGLALAGEHVLELADQLQLTAQQRQSVQQLFDAMKTEAVAVGERLIEQEGALDREFAERRISPANLERLTSQIGETHGQLRAGHLKYHLTTADLLTTNQRHRYATLRGYR